MAVPADKAFVLPESFRGLGALVEPVSCAIHGCDLLSINIADHGLIYGAGTMASGVRLRRAIAAGSVSVIDR